MKSNKKTHIGVYGIIRDQNKILLIKKSRGPYKDMLDLPGGRPEFGESMLDALKREVQEETGVIVEQAALYDVFTKVISYQEQGQEIEFYHIGIIYKIDKFSTEQLASELQHEDSLGTVWYDPNSKTDYELSPFTHYVIKV